MSFFPGLHMVFDGLAAARMSRKALPHAQMSLGEIFAGSVPYWICLLAAIMAIAVFPEVAT